MIRYSLLKLKQIDAKSPKNIVVLGDSVIDDYKYGNVSRISPEFPVPILNSEDDTEEQVPGGASNVCIQFTHLNVNIDLITFKDKPLSCILENKKFNSEYSVDLENGRVPRKIRFYNGIYPLLRWDIEKKDYGENNLIQQREEALNNLKKIIEVKNVDAVILSDYNKGFFDESLAQSVINLCKDKNILTIVDPKCSNLHWWKGANYIKPNSKEAFNLTGKVQLIEQFNVLESYCDHAIITDAELGVHYLEKNGLCTYNSPIKLQSREVNSVIGAGDCFISYFATCLVNGLSLEESSSIAFEAGATYVMACHNEPVTIYSIISRLYKPFAKIIDSKELLYITQNVFYKKKYGIIVDHKSTLILDELEEINNLRRDVDTVIILQPNFNKDCVEYRLKNYILSSLSEVEFIVDCSSVNYKEVIEAINPQLIINSENKELKELEISEVIESK